MPLQGIKILLGVSGGIAAYKSIEVLRSLQRAKADVQIIMTEAAKRFVQPLTFEALSHRKVHTDLFPDAGDPDVLHVRLAQWADIILVAPATANFIGKIANGLSDDLLSCILLASKKTTLFAPAMESHMFAHSAVQRNLSFLKDAGYHTVGPMSGALASGAEGIGRMAEPDQIVQAAQDLLMTPQSLAGRRVIVTAGRTEQPIDPVRFITNRSTGKMGYAIAEQAQKRGADVVLISGPSNLAPPPGVDCVSVRTVAELKVATENAYNDADALIMTAAVLDFRPDQVAQGKLKKSADGLTLHLVPNEDFLIEIGKQKGARKVIGFAMETDNALDNARGKLSRKNLDLIVLNELNVEGAGFGGDTNVVTLIAADGQETELPLMSKHAVADHILDWLVSQWA
ncbi:MAG: bifunctional phosphopantothenoylcysteine decarboxylase/phosphopantothenate--cysteine ligase CoaBC [Candidatus Latescibacteria bacterium]|nr:bifunctional phosphopantothenoylcysteine decarboxylase/phosphopantothenate--cysteine ligase CoaBC [Candidatus Latescibacterota bacterium]